MHIRSVAVAAFAVFASPASADSFILPSCPDLAAWAEAHTGLPYVSLNGPGTLDSERGYHGALFAPGTAELFGVEVFRWTIENAQAFDAAGKQCREEIRMERDARLVLHHGGSWAQNLARLQAHAHQIVDAGLDALGAATGDPNVGAVLAALDRPLLPDEVPAFEQMLRNIRTVRLDSKFARALATIPPRIQQEDILPRVAALAGDQATAIEARLMAVIGAAPVPAPGDSRLDLTAMRDLSQITAEALEPVLPPDAAARVAAAAAAQRAAIEAGSVALLDAWAGDSEAMTDAESALNRFGAAAGEISAWTGGALRDRLEAALAAALARTAEAVADRALLDLARHGGETLDDAQDAVVRVSNPVRAMRFNKAAAAADRLEAEGYALVKPIAARVPPTIGPELAALPDGRAYDFRWQQMKLWVRGWPPALADEAAAILAAVDLHREERRAAAMAADAGPLAGRRYDAERGSLMTIEFLDDTSALVASSRGAEVVVWRDLPGDRVLVETASGGLLLAREPGRLVAPDGTVFTKAEYCPAGGRHGVSGPAARSRGSRGPTTRARCRALRTVIRRFVGRTPSTADLAKASAACRMSCRVGMPSPNCRAQALPPTRRRPTPTLQRRVLHGRMSGTLRHVHRPPREGGRSR